MSRLTTAERAAETADRERLKADRRCQGAQRHAELQERRSELLQRKAELDAIVSNAMSIRSRAAEHDQVEETIKPAAAALADLHQAAEAATAADEALAGFEAIDLAALELAAATAASAQQNLDEELDGLNDRATQFASVLNSANEVRRCRSSRTREHGRWPSPVTLHSSASKQNA